MGNIFDDMEKRLGIKRTEFYLHQDVIKKELEQIPLWKYSEKEWVELLYCTFIEKRQERK